MARIVEASPGHLRIRSPHTLTPWVLLVGILFVVLAASIASGDAFVIAGGVLFCVAVTIGVALLAYHQPVFSVWVFDRLSLKLTYQKTYLWRTVTEREYPLGEVQQAFVTECEEEREPGHEVWCRGIALELLSGESLVIVSPMPEKRNRMERFARRINDWLMGGGV